MERTGGWYTFPGFAWLVCWRSKCLHPPPPLLTTPPPTLIPALALYPCMGPAPFLPLNGLCIGCWRLDRFICMGGFWRLRRSRSLERVCCRLEPCWRLESMAIFILLLKYITFSRSRKLDIYVFSCVTSQSSSRRFQIFTRQNPCLGVIETPLIFFQSSTTYSFTIRKHSFFQTSAAWSVSILHVQ